MNDEKLENRIERILDQLQQLREDNRKLKTGQGEIKNQLDAQSGPVKLGIKVLASVGAASLAIGVAVAKLF